MAALDMELWAPMGACDGLRVQFLENAEGSNSERTTTDEPVAERLLHEVAVPTLVITAGRDVGAINAIGERLAQPISGGRYAVIDDADHMVPWRAPEQLARLISEFVH